MRKNIQKIADRYEMYLKALVDNSNTGICEDISDFALSIARRFGDAFEPDFREAAKLTDVLASTALFTLYVEMDATKAFEYFNHSAKSGHVNSMLALSIMYLEGIGCKQNSILGDYWIKRVIENDPNEEIVKQLRRAAHES